MSLELENTAWSIARGKTDDYQFDIRFRTFHIKPDEKNYNQRLNIFWGMNNPCENGYPSEEELDALHEFENRVIDTVEHDEFSIMSLVLTGNGQREFVFHIPDPNEFIFRLSGMPQEDEPYPIEIHCNEDPEWEYYHNEMAHIQGA